MITCTLKQNGLDSKAFPETESVIKVSIATGFSQQQELSSDATKSRICHR